MTQFYRYRNAIGAASEWTVDLGDAAVRFGALDGLTELAEHLQVGTSSIVLDDPDANLGHDGDGILGLQRFEIDETAMAAGNRRLWSGVITQTTYRRGGSDRPSLRLGAKRQIELSVVDLNTIPSLRVIDPHDPDAKRPAETVDDRLAWILGSTYLSGLVADNGLVESSGALMDAVPEGYGGQTAANVIGDCEIAAGFGWNAWVYYDEATDQPSLGFLNANTSTTYTSTLRLSNVLEDLDATTLAPGYEAELSKDPSSLISGVHVAWSGGDVYRESAATNAIYGPRQQTAPSSNVKSATTAGRIAEDYLFQHSTDADNIETTVELAADQVNLIRAGHRLQVKFSHLPGYQDWTWTRVIRRSVTALTADLYSLSLDLSPQEAAAPAGPSIVQTSVRATGPGGGTSSFPAPVTVGNLLVYMACKRNDTAGPDAPNTTVDHPRWGADPWIDATPATTRVEWDNKHEPPAYQERMKLYWKVADATDQDCGVDEYTVGACWEVSGSTMTGAAIVYKDLQGLATTHAIGSLGTPDAGQVALLILGLGAGNTAVALNPGSWVRDIHGDGFAHVWDSNTNTVGFNMPASPETWIGHQIADGSPLAATLTDPHAHKWGGIAIVLAPA